ncbi:MAG TPA: hypothetical protein VEC36_01765 [Patescibacteria group bacterium]|nr:hypothetical protein [Patescibacteria group bacterium]
MIAYGLLLLVWIILPTISTSDSLAGDIIAQSHYWETVAAVPACLYFCTMLKFGFLKRLYEPGSRIVVGIVWAAIFTFFKITEITFKNSYRFNDLTTLFNDFFDLVFVLSFPVSMIVIYGAQLVRQNPSKQAAFKTPSNKEVAPIHSQPLRELVHGEG